MWEIEKRFQDEAKSYWLRLNADKVIHSYSISYPIMWQGLLNNDEIELVQMGQSSNSVEDFEFVSFPVNSEELKELVTEIINIHLKKIN